MLLLVLALVYVVLGALALLVLYAGAQFASALPQYKEEAAQFTANLQATLQGLGFSGTGTSALAGVASGALDATEALYRRLVAAGEWP